MITPDVADFFRGKHSFKEWNSFLSESDHVKKILAGMSEAELKELRDFTKGRHSPEEWEAFLAYVQLPLWKRALSRIAGMVLNPFL